MKNLNVKKKFLLKLKFFVKHPSTRHIKNKVINFAPNNKSIMAYRLPSTNLE